jgi:hypothetical protein
LSLEDVPPQKGSSPLPRLLLRQRQLLRHCALLASAGVVDAPPLRRSNWFRHTFTIMGRVDHSRNNHSPHSY